MDSAAETPYALTLRLVREGQSAAAIQQALSAAGLSPEDIVTLLSAAARQQGDERAAELERQVASVEIDPAHQSLQELKAHDDRVSNLNRVMGIALFAIGVLTLIATNGRVLAYGVMLVGLGRLIASFVRPKRLAGQAPLDSADSAQRCAHHPTFRSIGTCPRCGSFCCRDCAPERGFKGTRACRHCALTPSYREHLLTSASHRVAIALSVPAITSSLVLLLAAHGGLFVDSTFGAVTAHLPLATCLLIFAAPFAVLSALQWTIRHPWPALLTLIVTALTSILLMETTDRPVDWSIAVLAVPAVITATLLPEHWTRYGDARANESA